MREQRYITEDEIEKCKKVSFAFNELYNQTDIIVINTIKYGFVKLQYYDCENGFQSISTYTTSNDLFEALWQEWVKEQLFSIATNTSLLELEYEDIFYSLSEELQKKILNKKNYFRQKQSQTEECKNINFTQNQPAYITSTERERCKIVADIFYDSLEKDNLILFDAEKYGFVLLTYFEPPIGFDDVITFTNSQTMFNMLLEEWYVSRIMELAKEMNMTNLDVDVFYKHLTDEKKALLKKQKQEFIEKAREIANFIAI